MPPSTETREYDALLSTTLANIRPVLEDEISTSNALLFFLMRRQSGGYMSVASPGERAEVPLMYELTGADFYSGYDQLDVTPMDGMTKAFFDWREISVPISISRKEERQNSGEARIINLLKGKTRQSLLGIQDLFGKALLQGNGPNTATAITTPYTSPSNGALGFDPVPKLIANDPTGSLVVGNIDQATYEWWRNQDVQSSATTFAGFLKEARNMNNRCAKGPGGAPNFHVVDQNVFELYETALAAAHRNPSYNVADIPFDNIAFKKQPMVWDEFVPDADNGTIASIPVASSGTWYMMNTRFIGIQYDAESNFITTPFVRPENQTARTAHILWMGTTTVSNRRKQGVLSSIDTTIES